MNEPESPAGRPTGPRAGPRPARSLSLAESARAALAASGGETPSALVVVWRPRVQRIAVHADGSVDGTLDPPELHGLAVAAALDSMGEAGGPRSGSARAETTSEGSRGGQASDAPSTRNFEVAGQRYDLYIEPHFPPEELIVVGAGHIAVPLARLGAELGFRVTVLDDRTEFATPARFPPGARVLQADLEEPFRGLRVGGRSYVVLVTRGHEHDFHALSRLLELDPPPRYVGMIGSRRRVRAAFQALLGGGVPAERLMRVHAPVGLDIGAETPAEIAVSIAAELILVRRGLDPAHAGGPLSTRERVLQRLVRDGDDAETAPSPSENDVGRS